MPIASPIGYLDVVNATLRASQVEAVSRLSVANTATTQSFSVGDRFHVNKDSVDPVSITGNVVASGVKIGNLSISPAFDFASVSNVGNVTANVIQFANATTGFVTSSNVEIGGNISLTANAQVKIGSNVLAEYTGPHPREPKEVPLKKYPEIVFEEGKFDKTDVGNTFIQAGYTVTGSGTDSNSLYYPAWLAFNGRTVGLGDAWHSEDDYNSTTGAYSGLKTTSETSNTWSGDYVELNIPKPVKMSHLVMFVQPMSGTTNSWESRFPKEFVVLGSQDGTTWSFIKNVVEADGFIPPAQQDVGSYLRLDANAYYTHFRIVVSKNRGNAYATIGELEYYGYEEPAPPGDLSLDTTIKSTFNSVRSNNYVMYFDGEGFDPNDTNSNNLVTGSSVSVVHHNATYDSTGKYWTLDGSTESNVTTGDLGFEGDVPHTVSMWVNASNVEDKQLFSIGSGYDKSFLKVDDIQIAANTWHNVTYAYQGEGGSKVTYVDGRKVEEAQVEDTFGEYPPFAMTDYEVGGFRVSASSEYPGGYTSWKAFDDLTGATDYWSGSSSIYSPTGTFNFTGTASTYKTTVSGVLYTGEWIQIEMPNKLVLNYTDLKTGGTATDRFPRQGVFAGSNDGVHWDAIHMFSGLNGGTDETSIVTNSENNTRGYKYIRLIITHLNGNGFVGIATLKLYGHRENDLTRFPEPTRVLKYPHIAMTGLAQRGYVATASSVIYNGTNTQYQTWKAFDNTLSGNHGWVSLQVYNQNSPGEALSSLGAAQFPAASGRYGEYLDLQLPHGIKVNKFIIKTRPGSGAWIPEDSPGAGYLYGSNNGTTWTEIKAFSGLTYGGMGTDGGTQETVQVDSTTAYKYLRLQATHRAGQNSTDQYLAIGELEFYGTQEDTQTPAIVGGPFAGKVANFRVYDTYLGEERIQEIYDAQKDAFGHKKSSMTFYKGRIGVGTTEPEGALTVVDEPHALAKFPERAISSDDGEIKLSAADGSGYQAFDGLATTTWRSTPEKHTRLSEEVDFGAWLKMETPESISLKKAEIASNPAWEQVGVDVDGPGLGGNFGRAIACSHDGTRIIAGGQNYNSNQGVARVYDWNGSAWTQVGQTLTGTWSNGQYGRAVAISGDGNIIAVSAPYEHTAYTDAGTVRVYYLSGSTWTVLPDNGNLTVNSIFVGTTNYMYLGMGRIQLSYDGKTLAMCEYGYDDGSNTNAGRVLVYQYSDGAWSYKGSGATQFVGSAANILFGFGLSMSEDGNHLALGTLDAGHFVEVYTWDGSAWSRKGLRLNEPSSGNTQFGSAVSISNDGNTLAVGIINADVADGALATDGGLVHVYHWTGSAWGTPHKLTYNEAVDEDFGGIVELSGDGKRLIVGARGENSNQGEVFTFEYTGTSWVLRTPGTIGANGDINGYLGLGPITAGGHSIALSRDGSTIAGGELGHDSSNGRFRVFSMPSNIKSIWGSNDDVNWTKITTAPTREEATSNVAGFQFGYDDRLEFKNLDNPNYYKYHAIVADAFTRLKDIKLFGVRKQGSSTLHDGTLTLTKNLDVPRIGPPPDADDTPQRDRLVVEYNTSTNPMEDGLVKDTSGRGLDGLLVGGAYYDSTEKALVFPGTVGSYIKTTNLKAFVDDQAHTIGGWFKRTNTSTARQDWFVLGTESANRTSAFSIYTSGASTYAYGFSNDIYSTTNQIPDTSWYHVMITFVGGIPNTTNKKVYINGVDVTSNFNGSTATQIQGFSADSFLVLGTDLGLVNYPAPLKISNFKLYDVALTAQEVKTLYDMGRNGSVANPQPLHIAAPLYAPGASIQTVAENVHDIVTYASANSRTITPLTINIKPRFANSKILLHWMINAEFDANNLIVVYRNGVKVGYNTSITDASWVGLASSVYDADVNSTIENLNVSWIDAPGTTENLEYTVVIKAASSGSAYPIYFNRTASTQITGAGTTAAGIDNYERTVSFKSATEIAQ